MLNARRRRHAAVLLAMLTAIMMMFAGCGSSKTTAAAGNANVNSEASSPVSSQESSAAETTESFSALLTYANYAYIESGDASQPKLLRKISRTVSLSSADEAVQIEAAIQALASLPADQEAETFVGQNIAVKSVEISGSTAVVDLEEDGLDDASMYDEEFFIYQVTDTILNSFRDINGVRFTVDGTNTDSLNYMDISSPFTAADITEFLNSGTSESDETAAAVSDNSKKTTETTEASEKEDGKKESADSENASSGSKNSSQETSDSTSDSSSAAASSDDAGSQSASDTSSDPKTPDGVVNDKTTETE